jgi:DNA polymerase III gamma/tau subunit
VSLYNKYRPESFEEMLGNQSILRDMFKSPHHNHFLMFTGNAGTGKSTAARIIAKMLEADSLDVWEVNCSDYTGVDDMREIIESTYPLPFGPNKVIILDEAHRLTNQAQESLNKPLEDIPKRVYWILITSHPEKITKSIQTRATRIHFPDLPVEDLFTLVKQVVAKEGETLSNDVISKIAEHANGSARNALTLLETVLAMDVTSRKSYFDSYNDESAELIDLSRAVLGKNWNTTVALFSELQCKYEAETMRRAVLGYLLAVMKKNCSADIVKKCSYLLDNVYETGYNGLLVALAKCNLT